MTQPAIRVDRLAKRYRLGMTHARSVRELVNSTAGKLLGRRTAPPATVPAEQADRVDAEGCFWALRDVSFEVQPGEVVGVIGKNGAGKSTLLKILSRITTPTQGRAELRGRVASLLEVGTGFHPELTGRENVFLNGTILGMTKEEVRRQFEAIVEFAGIGGFIDTPVKRYSSGMAVRLGFAVAAHLDPEILIVDEVLAVGDVEFQQRCLGKMQQVSDSGKTVLFVSHNMASIRTLTRRALVISRGRLAFQGPTEDAVQHYVSQNRLAGEGAHSVASAERSFGGLSRQLEFHEIGWEQGGECTLTGDETPSFWTTIRARGAADDFLIGLTVYRADQTPVGTMFSAPAEPPSQDSEATHAWTLPVMRLAPGRYQCAISLVEARSNCRVVYDSISDILPFEVLPDALQVRWVKGWGAVQFPPLVHDGARKAGGASAVSGRRSTAGAGASGAPPAP